MRKLKLQIQVSIDGFAAGPNSEHDWVFLAGPDEAAFQKIFDLAESSDTILGGRKMMLDFPGHWENVVDTQPESSWHPFAQMMVNHRKVVFSRTENSIPGRNLKVENGDLATAVQALKEEPGKDILVYGGVNFVSSLISLNLIDEYYIINCPIALGAGYSIFKERKILKLEHSITYKNGKVLNKYVPV